MPASKLHSSQGLNDEIWIFKREWPLLKFWMCDCPTRCIVQPFTVHRKQRWREYSLGCIYACVEAKRTLSGVTSSESLRTVWLHPRLPRTVITRRMNVIDRLDARHAGASIRPNRRRVNDIGVWFYRRRRRPAVMPLRLCTGRRQVSGRTTTSITRWFGEARRIH